MKIMFQEEEVNQRIQEVVDQINRDYGDTPLHLICILKDGTVFMREFAKRFIMPISFDFMSVPSHNGTESSSMVRIVRDLDESLENRRVLIVEDIIDTSHTPAYLIEALEKGGPEDIHPCTLLDKPEHHVRKQVTVDYVCFTIPDRFVAGHGLDYDQKYRNYSYVDVVELEDDKA